MDTQKDLVSQIYIAVSQKNAEQAVQICFRLAQLTNDHLYSIIFMRHLYKNSKEGLWHMCEDIGALPKELVKYIDKKSFNIWLQTHTISTYLSNEFDEGEEKNVLNFTIGEISNEILHLEAAISELVCPQGLTPFDTAAFLDKFTQQKFLIRNRIKMLLEVQNKILYLCLSYVTSFEKKIYGQIKTYNFLEVIYEEVNNYFNTYADDVYLKLLKASELIYSDDIEDMSLVLTEVRRTIKSVADFFYPPQFKEIVCSDGKMRKLGEDNYLNRLNEFIMRRFSKSTSRELIKLEFETLSIFVRKIDSIASKGVHSIVDKTEAKQGLVGLYFLLYNIIHKLENSSD